MSCTCPSLRLKHMSFWLFQKILLDKIFDVILLLEIWKHTFPMVDSVVLLPVVHLKYQYLYFVGDSLLVIALVCLLNVLFHEPVIPSHDSVLYSLVSGIVSKSIFILFAIILFAWGFDDHKKTYEHSLEFVRDNWIRVDYIFLASKLLYSCQHHTYCPWQSKKLEKAVDADTDSNDASSGTVI